MTDLTIDYMSIKPKDYICERIKWADFWGDTRYKRLLTNVVNRSNRDMKMVNEQKLIEYLPKEPVRRSDFETDDDGVGDFKYEVARGAGEMRFLCDIFVLAVYGKTESQLTKAVHYYCLVASVDRTKVTIHYRTMERWDKILASENVNDRRTIPKSVWKRRTRK